jgi:hypothetical protein
MGLNFKALIETGFKWLHTMRKKTRGVSHCGLANYIKKSILRQRKNYGNSNVNSPCKNITFKNKSSKRNQNPSRYHNSIIISTLNTSQNTISQKSWYKNRPTT